MRNKPFTAYALCFILFTLAAQAKDTRQFVTNSASDSVSMKVSGKTCWTYVLKSREGKPYFHPLTIPGTDDVLTSFRPPDHTWHLGFWFSWKFINGCNFWEPDPNGVTRVLSQTVTPGPDKTLRIEATLSYEAKGSEIVREHRAALVTTQTNGNYAIAWDSTFTAQGADAVFSSTPSKKDSAGNWASGGYGGLMWRFANSPAIAYTFSSASGKTDVQTCGETNAWLAVVATAQASGAQAKITFSDHPENPRYPTPWFARYSATAHNNRGYYLVGPSLTFHEPFTLPAGKSAHLRYTVTVERL